MNCGNIVREVSVWSSYLVYIIWSTTNRELSVSVRNVWRKAEIITVNLSVAWNVRPTLILVLFLEFNCSKFNHLSYGIFDLRLNNSNSYSLYFNPYTCICMSNVKWGKLWFSYLLTNILIKFALHLIFQVFRHLLIPFYCNLYYIFNV